MEIKVMSVSEFMKTANMANEEELEKMYLLIQDNRKREYIRLDRGSMPLYECDGSVFGGGDCVCILSHREGYGYTVIDVGDRGSWMCTVRSEQKGLNDIAFYDGEFEEVYESLIKHF